MNYKCPDTRGYWGVTMICPKCKQEYITEGFTCPVCNIVVSDKLTLTNSTFTSTDEFDYEFLLATFNDLDISLVRSILDHEKINYSVKGIFSYGSRVPARVMVRKDQYEFAVDMLKDVRLNYSV